MLNSTIINADLDKIILNNEFVDQFKNKSILITGGTGLIASYLIGFFNRMNLNNDANISLTVNVRSKSRFNDRMGINIENLKIIEKSVQDLNCDDIAEERIDFIFHLAGSSSPYAIRNNPTDIIQANVNGTIAVLEVAKVKGAKVFYSSTREVYGATEDIQLLKEDDVGITNQTELRSCYPESKRMAENIFVSYHHEFKIDYVIARIAHLYGPTMAISNDGRIMSDLIGNIANRENIELISDGSALRAFCYISDAIEAILKMTLKGSNEIFNLSNETEEVSILELSKLLISLVPDSKLEVTHLKNENAQSTGYLNFKRVGLDTRKLEKIGWVPKVGLKDGLKNTIDYFSQK